MLHPSTHAHHRGIFVCVTGFLLLILLTACTPLGAGDSTSSSSASSSVSRPATGSGTSIGTGCKVGGCSGQLCLNQDSGDVMTTCEWTEAYACYRTAKCEKQGTGNCDWTQTPELVACLSESL